MSLFRSLAACLVLLGVSLGVSVEASAQGRIDVERFVPALDGDGFIGIQATRTPGPGRWNFGLWTSWSTNPLTVGSQAVIEDRVSTNFQFQVGIGGRLALGVVMPLALYQNTTGVLGGGAIESSAAGDPRIVARYRLLGRDSVVEQERNEGPGVALQLTGTLPFGDDGEFAAETEVTTDLQALADFHVLGAGVGAMLGWRHRFESQVILGSRFRDEIEFGAALKAPIPVTRDFLGILEVRGVTDAGNPFGEQATTAVEGNFALRIRRGDLTLTGGVGTGFSGGVGTPAFRALLGLSWAPRVRDADGDMLPDDRDECRYMPEDYDTFEDSDGCPDPDNDNDMVLDGDDRCPNEAAEEGRDEDEDGCTDAAPDADGDQVLGAADRCPDQAEDRDGYEDEDGCPDPDNDGDGLADGDDQCPDEAEDMDGVDDEDGCPDLAPGEAPATGGGDVGESAPGAQESTPPTAPAVE